MCGVNVCTHSFIIIMYVKIQNYLLLQILRDCVGWVLLLYM